jgi:anti-sigma factor RsiW
MSHLTPDQLSAFQDGALSAEERRLVESHLATCVACRGALADLAAADESLGRVLAHDPGEAYFESFAARVAERIEAEVPAVTAHAAAPGKAAARPERERAAGTPWYDIGSWFRTPQRLAWVGGTAAIVVAAGVVLMVARESVAPGLRDPQLVRRGAQTAPGKAEPAPAPEADLEAQKAEGATGEESAADAAPTPRADASEDRESAAPSARARQMRRLPGGEDVPVGGSSVPGFATPPEEPAPATSGEFRTVQRPRRVSPLRSNERAESEPKEAQTTDDAAAKAAPAPVPAPAPLAPSSGAARETERVQVQRDAVASSCGTVVDARGRGVARAQVVLADRGVTATTDADGRFCFEVAPGEYDISVFAVGYAPLRKLIPLGGADEDARLAVRTVDVLPPPAGAAPAPSALGATPPTRLRLPAARSMPAAVAMPDSVRALWARAETLGAEGERDASAARLDTAALAWNSVLARLSVGEAEIAARDRLAVTRVRAWEISPDPTRAAAARTALTGLIARLPAGPRRDWARGALARLAP